MIMPKLNFILLLVLLLSGLSPFESKAKMDLLNKLSPAMPEAIGFTAIAGNPLIIYVGRDASYQVAHASLTDPNSPGLVYETSEAEADGGLFVRHTVGTSDYVIGPDFLNHNTSAANLYDPWLPISQSSLQGSGTAADPWRIETVVKHDSGITMTTLTSYVNGHSYFTLTWSICGPANHPISTFLAADVYLQAGIPEQSLGFHDIASGAVGAYNTTSNWSESLLPLTAATRYFAGNYLALWNNIGQAGQPGPGFDDSVNTTATDNGIGLQWNLIIINNCATLSARWQITPPGGSPIPTAHRLYLPLTVR